MYYYNPVIPGFNPDPTVCRAGDDFYLATSTFEYFPGLPIYHSRDLINWDLIGNALDRDTQLSLQSTKSSDGLFAPTLRYNKGTFYLTCNNVGGGGNFIVTSKNPAGPWSEPFWLDDYGIDGSMFFDDDGKIYYSRAGIDGQNGIMQAELDPATLKLATPFKQVWEYEGEWNEGPHLYKIKGKYYVIAATGGTESQHQEVVARGGNPWGPFESNPFNPMLTERDDPNSPIQCAGHADLVEGPDGSWWAVFLGVRRHEGTSALGRETFLAPVRWVEGGWPIIGDNHHVATQMEFPSFVKSSTLQKNQRQHFNIPALGPEWIYVRNPQRQNYSLSERPGFLRIRGSAGTLEKITPQSFIGRRQQDFKMSTRCSLEFSPSSDNEEAGLCLRANDDNHYQIAAGRLEGEKVVFFRSVLDSQGVIMASAPCVSSIVFLEIAGNESRYQFSWSKDGKEWHVLAGASSKDVSPENIKSFTGAVIGMYSTGNGKPCQNPADFEWFEYSAEGVSS
jgi:alpha-N-arabinofuranosidase